MWFLQAKNGLGASNGWFCSEKCQKYHFFNIYDVLTQNDVTIGPYDVAYSKNRIYNIPGRKEMKASHPIPSHGSNIPMKDALMFRPAYR